MEEKYQEIISALQEEIRVLKEKDVVIAELKEQLRKNSQNSSKPPSSDGYRK